MSVTTIIENCRLCGSNALDKVLPLKASPTGDLYLKSGVEAEKLPCYSLDVMQCTECGHVQLELLVNPEDIYRNYIYTTSISLGLREHFKAYAASVIDKLSLEKGSSILEMGSNDGTLLRIFKEHGFQVQGIDPAKKIAEAATLSGIPTLNDFFTPNLARNVVAKSGAVDLFIANNVLANVPSVHEIVEGVKAVLKPNGVFVFETGYLSYLAEDCVFDNVHHEHIDYFAVTPLVQYFKNKGMQVFEVEVSPSKGGSIRCYVQNESGVRPVSESVTKQMIREEKKGYFVKETYTNLSLKLDKIKEEIHCFLDKAEKEGKVVAGFGASIGVTTMLYHLDLGKRIQYLVDDNVGRHGLRSPGNNLEIKNPSILIGTEKPDYLMMLAWRYEKSIMERHQQYQKLGGIFVRVLPQFTIISGS